MKWCCTRLMVVVLAATCTGLLAFPGESAADDTNVNVNSFRPSLHPGDILGIRSNTMPKQWDWGAGAWLTYQYKPLKLTFNNTQLPSSVALLKHQFIMDVYGHVAFLDWLHVGLALPMVFVSKGEAAPTLVPNAFNQVSGVTLGDLRLSLKFRIIGGNGDGWGFGISEDLTFPNSTKDNFSGDTNVTSTTRLIGDYSQDGWNMALNVGFRFRKPHTVFGNNISHQLLYGLGISAPTICGTLEVLGTLEGHTSLTDPFQDSHGNLLNLMAGLRWYTDVGVNVTATGGGGVLNGFGSPAFIGAVNVEYAHKKLEKGCEVPVDSDGDGIIDEEDACPADPGPPETGGCPDRDGDGIIDADDQCPDDPGPPETQGCPDTDGDGIVDSKDACPKTPGVAKYSGCPDTDGDGIPDIDDKCPEEPGVVEYQGCPEPVVVKIVISEKVFFDYDSNSIKKKSYSILRELSTFIKDNPQLKKIFIEGHTDSKGSVEYNNKLSLRRAKAVKGFLVKRGVKSRRLKAKGFGPSDPIADNGTDEGRAQNRRVEFIIQD